MRTFDHIVCATIPRSGHHFLESIFRGYFGDDWFYCYRSDKNDSDCCRSRPCLRSEGRLTVRKTHDPLFTVPCNDEQTFYLIQFREPVGQLLSYAEWTSRRINAPFAADLNFTEWWVALHAAWCAGFLAKWANNPAGNVMLIEYTELASRPNEIFAAALRRLGRDANPRQIQCAVALAAGVTAQGPHRNGTVPFTPRDLTRSPVLPPALVGAFDACVRERAPFVAWPPSPIPAQPDPDFDRLVTIVGALAPFSALQPSREVLAAAEVSNNMHVRKALARWKRRTGAPRDQV